MTYSKVDVATAGGQTEKHVQRKSSRKARCIAVFVGVLVLVGAVVGTAVGVTRAHKHNDSGSGDTVGSNSVSAVCSGTLYPDVCNSTLSGVANGGPQKYVLMAMKAAMQAVNDSMHVVSQLRDSASSPNGTQTSALDVCKEVLADSLDQLNTSIFRVADLSILSLKSELGDIQTFMSASLTYQDTCLENLKEFGAGNVQNQVNGTQGVHGTELLSNALSLVNILSKVSNWKSLNPFHRRLLLSDESLESLHPQRDTPYDMEEDPSTLDSYPKWLSVGDRRLLQAGTIIPTPDVTVALDGSGQYKSIQAAVDAAPTGIARHVIHIKRGVYNEYVTVPKTKHNLMFLGDGAGATILSGSKSVAGSQVTTFLTATLAVLGQGFIARDLTIRNTAGAKGMQAVALRVSSDQSAFSGLSIEGYQDTLYTLSLRQFYTQCTILGTVDYIFGNSAAVFQNCKLLARAGLPSQQNTYTASGRSDPSQNTGLSFLSCTLDANSDLQTAGTAKFPTYLGRPWKTYARTVFIKSTLGSLINPAGWLLWNNAPGSGDRAYYAEYANTGPGAGSAGRVKWSKQIGAAEANQFSAGNFISGQSWLPDTTVAYSLTL